jgi:putative NIF3 family GTP cyclohydrolase 1 type 2
MERPTPLPSVSIVIEWDNVVLTEADRPRAMLAALRPQLKAAADRMPAHGIQLIAVHDEAEVSREAVAQMLATELGGLDVEIQLHSTQGLRYYEQKNAGAAHATRDVVLFFDCDTVPQDSWLVNLLEAFADPTRQVAAGYTEVELEDYLGRCFALFWFFDRRPAPEGPTDTFKANNVAFRRPLFESLPFPESVGYRVQHHLQIEELERRGVTIWFRPEARISHPRPRMWKPVAVRAICQGHDHVVRMRYHHKIPRERCRKIVLRRFLDDLGRSARRISTERSDVGLGVVGAVGAFGLAVGYHVLVLAGALATTRFPRFVRRHFRL